MAAFLTSRRSRPLGQGAASPWRAPFMAAIVGLALLVSTAALAKPGPATADASSAPVALTLNVVHATAQPGGVAPELERIAKWLTRSFPNYMSFKRLGGREDVVKVGGEVSETLPNGTVLTYKHLGWKEGFATLSLSVGGLETTVNVKDGKGFLQAGRAYKDGMIVLAFRVVRAP